MPTTRDHIIETTCALLDLQGYHATGVNEIVKASGSPKGSLYHYFPGGKEELTEEALEYVGRIVLARIERHLGAGAAPGPAIATFILLVAQNVEAAAYKAGGPITTVALETAATSDRLRRCCERIYGSWHTAFKGRLVAGGFTSDHADALATLVLAALEGGILLCRTQRSPEPLRQVAAMLQQLIEATGVAS